MHLIPRTPTPIPLEERAYETLTEAEKMELFMRYKVEFSVPEHHSLT